ncbi:MAG: DUF3429 domain-containing protein [Rhizobiaceae bacterium]
MKAITEYLTRSARNKTPTDLALTRRNAWALSIAGYIPFAIFTLGLWVLLPETELYSFNIDALKTYGAVILSFLGGVRWGLALKSASEVPARRELIYAVIPSLVGWFSLNLDEPYVFAVQALAFAAHGAWDTLSGERGTFAMWFVKLRMVLTFLVTGALIAAFFATV